MGRVILKSPREIELLYRANQHTAEVLAIMCEAVRPGISTWDLDQIARREVSKRPVRSAFLGYRGYPAMICASVNEEIVHGIPNKQKILKDGDIIGLDFGLSYEGYVGDTARTVAVGSISQEAEALLKVTEGSLLRAVDLCSTDHRLSDIGASIQKDAEAAGLSVVRDFVGHGVGTQMHEDPQVLNYFDGHKPRMRLGLVIAIEPMLNLGTYEVEVLADGWTAVTQDRKLSAHFEHSIAITEQGPRLLSGL